MEKGVNTPSGPHSLQGRSPSAGPCRSRRWWRTTGDHLPDQHRCSCGTTGHRTGRGSSRGVRESCPGWCKFLGSKKSKSAHDAGEKRLLCQKTMAVNWADLGCLLSDSSNQIHRKVRRLSYRAILECKNWQLIRGKKWKIFCLELNVRSI